MSLPLRIFSIMLDAMPFCSWHLPVFNQLRCDWRWIVVEGSAMAVKDTSWCAPQPPRLSNDGTTQYLQSLTNHPRVRVMAKPSWQGKVEMVNAALSLIKEPCVLVQVDADELWRAETLQQILSFFEHEKMYNSARFYSRYFLGPNIVSTGKNTYGNRAGEWNRVWRFEPGMTFARHEPPELKGIHDGKEYCVNRDETFKYGWTFEHYAWVFESQVASKERFYRYGNALQNWKRLQANREWPVRELQSFLPWTGDGAGADLLCK